MSEPDLSSRDWIVFTQKALINSIDIEVSCEIVDFPNGKKKLNVSNISEATMEKLLFITNTDQNNNYLYLEDLVVHVFGSSNRYKSIFIPGLQAIALSLYRNADLTGFLDSSITKNPFTGANISKNSGTSVSTFGEFIDNLTNMIPFSIKTYGKVKLFSLVLNPDTPSANHGPPGPPGTWDNPIPDSG